MGNPESLVFLKNRNQYGLAQYTSHVPLGSESIDDKKKTM
jgi:hypothetical protein